MFTFFDHSLELWSAAERGDYPTAKLLIEEGANIYGKGQNARTPLHAAVRSGSLEIVQLLIEKAANTPPETKKLLLAQASNKPLAQVEDSSLNETIVNMEDLDGDTPLHFAARHNRLEIAKLLMQHEADIYAQNQNNETPLHLAAQSDSLEIAKILIEHEINNPIAARKAKHLPLKIDSIAPQYIFIRPFKARIKDVPLTIILVNIENGCGLTPLHLAIHGNSSLEMAEFLLSQGANVNAVNYQGRTPLYLAIENDHVNCLKMAELLIQYGAFVNVKKPSLPLDPAVYPPPPPLPNAARSPLDAVLHNGNIEIAALLFQKVATVDPKELNTALLHLAKQTGRLELIQWRLKHHRMRGQEHMHYNYESEPDCYIYELHLHIQERRLTMARLLIEQGADIHAKNRDDQTLLHLFAKIGDLQIANFLMQQGANLHALDKHNKTPIDYAPEYLKKQFTVPILYLLWAMEQKEYTSFLQWLPEEILEDTIAILQPESNPQQKTKNSKEAPQAVDKVTAFRSEFFAAKIEETLPTQTYSIQSDKGLSKHGPSS